jgi:hypothetical protein
MMLGMMQGLLPMLLAMIAKMPLADKRQFAVYAAALTQAYLADNQSNFRALLDHAELPDKESLIKALWNDAHQG